MFILTYTAAMLATCYLVIAAVFLIKFREKTKQIEHILALYFLSNSVWIGGNAIADVAYEYNTLIIASGIAFIGGSAALVTAIILVDMLIDRRLPTNKQILIYSIPNIGTSLFAFSGYAITNVYFPINEPAQITPGIIYTISLFLIISGFIYALTRLIINQKKKLGIHRMQLLYVATGLLITSAGEIIFDVILPLAGEIRFYTLGPISSIFFAICLSYAIVHHNFLDICIIIQRGFIYSMLTGLVIGVYLVELFVLEHLAQTELQFATIWSAGFTTLLGIWSVPHIERYLRRITDPIFFKDNYDHLQALRELSKTLNAHAELDTLIARAEEKLAQIFRSEGAHIILGEPTNDALECRNKLDALSVPITLDSRTI